MTASSTLLFYVNITDNLDAPSSTFLFQWIIDAARDRLNAPNRDMEIHASACSPLLYRLTNPVKVLLPIDKVKFAFPATEPKASFV